MEFKKMDEIQKRILMEVADLHTVPLPESVARIPG